MFTVNAQGLGYGLYFGLGMALGNLAGGFLYQLYGPRIMFGVCAAFASLVLLAFGALYLARYIRMRQPRAAEEQPPDAAAPTDNHASSTGSRTD